MRTPATTPSMAGLVAQVTVHELFRRRGALALTLLLPLTFYLVRLDTHWTALRLLAMGLGWAVATLALFTQVSSRLIDRRLVVAGARPQSLWAGRHLAVLLLGWVVAVVYAALVLGTAGDDLEHPGAVVVMLVLTATAAVPLGSLVAALVPRDLEGAMLLLAVMAVQLLVDPEEEWTRILPLWSARELASYVVEPLGAQAGDYLARGVGHAVAVTAVLLVLSAVLSRLRLRVVTPPLPAEPG
ncbi:ABC transporter permease [Actinomyces sp. 2119]|uniref:ABC transporter permease n=1 Tax=Actinomyces sp. 2119 TaxID=2321393 RepID=UPI0021757BDE|nr:ABC transporter permease [Actinomyces sp. 2119]